MRKLKIVVLALVLSTVAPSALFAQMTIDNLKATKKENVKLSGSMKTDKLDKTDYFSLARYRAERDSIRRARNTLEIIASLQGSLTSYNEPWVATSGGDNTTALLGSFTLNHKFAKDKFTVTSRVAANFGFNRVKIETGKDDEGATISEGVWYKNQDNFAVSVAPTFAISPIWSYGTTVAFRTQFASGYKSRSEQEKHHLKSSFMAPGYLDVSGGVTYKSPEAKLPFIVNMAPLALSAIYVNNSVVQENFLYQFKDHEDGNWKYTDPYGVSPYISSKYEGGSSIQIEFDRTFEKLNRIRYTTSVFTFYGWMTKLSAKNIVDDYDEYVVALKEWSDNKQQGVQPILGIRPTVRWENTISIPATSLLSTTIKFQLYYNRAQQTKIQTQTYLSVGLSYIFKNK